MISRSLLLIHSIVHETSEHWVF